VQLGWEVDGAAGGEVVVGRRHQWR
jgi:hypothetical protein